MPGNRTPSPSPSPSLSLSLSSPARPSPSKRFNNGEGPRAYLQFSRKRSARAQRLTVTKKTVNFSLRSTTYDVFCDDALDACGIAGKRHRVELKYTCPYLQANKTVFTQAEWGKIKEAVRKRKAEANNVHFKLFIDAQEVRYLLLELQQLITFSYRASMLLLMMMRVQMVILSRQRRSRSARRCVFPITATAVAQVFLRLSPQRTRP